MFGCDEAGRGPVFGSMFVACVSGSEEDVPSGVVDSKKLTNNQIERLRRDIESSKLRYSVVEITVDEIDSSDSLTDVSASAFADSIVDCGVESVEFGHIDCFTSDSDKAERLVQDIISDGIEVKAEFSADENRPLVSAASIMAKGYREEHVEELSSEHGDVGSGYPSDPNTRKFLEDFIKLEGHLPRFARSSWSTSQDMLEEYAN